MYVDSSGSVTNRKPITRYISDFFWGIIAFFTLLLSTFINPGKQIPKKKDDYSYGPSRTLGGGGGGSGGGGGPKGSNIRDMGNIRSRNTTCATG